MSLNKPVWKLRDWINAEYLDWSYLSTNPNTIKLLEENPAIFELDYEAMNIATMLPYLFLHVFQS